VQILHREVKKGMAAQEKINIRAKQLGELLRECRTAARLSQAELGNRLNIDRSVVSRIENGDISPSYELVKRWGIATNSRDVIGLEFSGAEDWKKVSMMKSAWEQIKTIANSVSFMRKGRTKT